jgi:hypothetical protein
MTLPHSNEPSSAAVIRAHDRLVGRTDVHERNDYDLLVNRLHAAAGIAYRLKLNQIARESEDLLNRVQDIRSAG